MFAYTPLRGFETTLVSISWIIKCTTILRDFKFKLFNVSLSKKATQPLCLAFDFLPSHGRTTRRCNKKDPDLLNAHQFADTSNSSFLHSFPTQKRLPDNLVYVRIPPPDVEPATNSVHRDRRSSKTSTGSNSKDASNPNSGSVSEGIYVIFFLILESFELFLKILVHFQAYRNLYSPKK